MAHEKWASQQIAIAIELGVNPLDAAEAMRAYLAVLPPNADPATYILPAYALEQDIDAKEYIDDARVEWYGREDIAPTWKRLLDASTMPFDSAQGKLSTSAGEAT